MFNVCHRTTVGLRNFHFPITEGRWDDAGLDLLERGCEAVVLAGQLIDFESDTDLDCDVVNGAVNLTAFETVVYVADARRRFAAKMS